MKIIKYFFQFLFFIFFFFLFKIFGFKISSLIGGKLFETIGPIFRSKELISSNIKKAMPNVDTKDLKKISRLMWNNYGRIFAEYVFIKSFRSGKLNTRISVQGQDILDKIKKNNQQVVFI